MEFQCLLLVSQTNPFQWPFCKGETKNSSYLMQFFILCYDSAESILKENVFYVRWTTQAIPFIFKDFWRNTFAQSMKPFPTRATFGHLFVLNIKIFRKPWLTTTAIQLQWNGLWLTFHYTIFSSLKTPYMLFW